MTRLWRVPIFSATKEESRKVKLSGTRTEVLLLQGDFCLFFIILFKGDIALTVTLKRTALFDSYQEYGGKTIDFGGWELPVQFSGIKAEHEAVRTKAGLFDV